MWGDMYITYAGVPCEDIEYNLENATLAFPKYWTLFVSLMKA